ncbi:lipase member I-like [Dermacentor variabilis]|uniref:lipase member I-like n=1 Tax=Dermacentor variabilis TaxID=34621 RepID=UPI003F5B615A
MALQLGGPARPQDVQTKIFLFSRALSYSIAVNDRIWKAKYVVNYKIDLQKPLIALLHGFNINNNVSWMYTMKDALLESVDCNVLIVEWLKGAEFPYYAAAAANSPMPGVLLSKLLQDMVETSQGKLEPKDIHIIGFSLGAHAAGFCGRHFHNATNKKVGRITGLDPAGPLFENTIVALSRTDAEFVDIIHTDSGILGQLKLGIKAPIGHVDFYPNGGHDQPGCEVFPAQSDSNQYLVQCVTVNASGTTSQCDRSQCPPSVPQ